MRKGLSLVLVLFLALTVGAFAFQNETYPFGDLKWGDPPTEDMELLVEYKGFLVYFCPDKVVIATPTSYLFWEERFCGWAMNFKGEDHYESLKETCIKAYGEWYDADNELNEGFLTYKLRWTKEKAYIDLWYDTQHEQGTWSIWSREIMQEKEEVEKVVEGFGFQNEPEGFRGLKWGDPPGEDMELVEESVLLGKRKYIRPSDKLFLGNVELDYIFYIFYFDSFVLVELRFSGKNNYELAKEICRKRFGKERISESYRLKWFSDYIPGISVELGYNYPSHPEEEGILSLSDLGMFTELVFMKAKEKAEKEKDW